jgi:hypothetical protein
VGNAGGVEIVDKFCRVPFGDSEQEAARSLRIEGHLD